MSDSDRLALEYIRAHGSAWQRWRADRLSAGGPWGRPTAGPPPGWAPAQHPDGGVLRPYAPSSVPCVGATSGMLVTMAFFELGDMPEGQRALSYAWATQQPDGRWTEDPTEEPTPPPPWFTPGDIGVDLWETANMVAGLAALGFGWDQRVSRAVGWAEEFSQADGGFPGYIHTAYGMASVQYRVGHRLEAEAHLGFAHAFLGSRPDIHDLNWGLMMFTLGGVPTTHPTVRAYLDAIATTQGADGLWPTMYAGSEVPFALEALELLDFHSRQVGAGAAGPWR